MHILFLKTRKQEANNKCGNQAGTKKPNRKNTTSEKTNKIQVVKAIILPNL